jgi:hypothetical protein
LRSFVPLFLFFFLLHPLLQAQPDSTWRARPEIRLGLFIDVFYAYDFNQPETDFRQTFLYNHNRHNEFNLNLGLVQLKLDHPRYRAALGLQTGTYPIDNYALEDGLQRIIFEAQVGLGLLPSGQLWLDVGIFPSHHGFASALSIDNFTLTRSLVAEGSPYFLTGAKLTYSPNEDWDFMGVVCNGWQRIRRVPGNSLLSFGTQIAYHPNENLLLNWSTFLGTDEPDSTRQMRYFSNIHGQFQINSRIGLIAGFDFGLDQRARGSSEYDFWWAPILILQYAFSDRWKAAFRAEYYADPGEVIVPTGTPNGFQTTGLSANLDFSPVPFVALRAEGRYFRSQDAVFEVPAGTSSDNFALVFSLAVKWEAILMKARQ